MMQDNNVTRLHSDEGDNYWTEATLTAAMIADEYEPAEFDLPAMLSRLRTGDAVSWTELMLDHHVARQTSVPCPEWCDLEPGHRYLIDTEPGEPQSREHRIDFTPEGVEPSEGYEESVSVQVLVPEVRHGLDDSTATLTLPHLWVNVTGSFSADNAAKIAAAILTATHKMRELEQ